MEHSKSTEMIILDGPQTTFGRRHYSKERIITLVVLAVALIFLIVGIVLITIAANDQASQKNEKLSGSSSKQEQEGKITEPIPKTTEPIPSTTIGVPMSTLPPGSTLRPISTLRPESTLRPISTLRPESTLRPTSNPSPSSTCDFSEEAKRVGLGEFLNRVKATYFKLHPYDVYWDPEATEDKIRTNFVGYDPTPSVIKNRTDTALGLLSEINGTKINADLLKPRERKALAQVKHYLQHMFGQPYDVNYYAGDWMMGPNLFCWQEICYQGYAVHNALGLHHKPYNASDVELIETKLKTHKAGILQYIKNMKMGVRKGMIRSVEECEAGINTIKRQYLNISLYNSTGKHYCVIVVFALCKQSTLM